MKRKENIFGKIMAAWKAEGRENEARRRLVEKQWKLWQKEDEEKLLFFLRNREREASILLQERKQPDISIMKSHPKRALSNNELN